MLEVTPLPCLTDNYAYLVRRPDREEAVVVDACEASPITAELRRRGLRLAAILSTHHHADHVGGNVALSEAWGVPIFGHASERARIPGLTDGVEDGDSFEVAGVAFRALSVPGHTRGAVCYCTDGAAFTGDTLFCAGSGRLFEGTPGEMSASLARIAALPHDTRVFTGHEYTLANLVFATGILPGDRGIAARLREVEVRRARGEVTASATIEEELATNLFLRTGEASLREALGLPPSVTDVEVFAELRRRKNAA